MNEETKKRIELLESRLAEVEAYIEEKRIQQLSYPLDEATKTIITNI